MAPLKNLKGTLTPAEFKTLRNAIDQIGIKDPAAVNRQILPDLPLRDFKKRVLGAVFRKVIPRVPYEEEIAGLIYTWYKAGGVDAQVKYDEALVDQYLNKTSQSLSEPPPKKAKKIPVKEEKVDLPVPGSSRCPPVASKPSEDSQSALTGKRYEWCWTHILNEFLDFKVAFSLSRTDKALKRIVADFLKLKINSSFITKYPIKKHHGTYSALGKSVKNLTLASLDKKTVNYLFKNFPNLEELTLSDIKILGDYYEDEVPAKIRKLKLLNCQFDHEFLERAFPRMFKNLTWARLSLPTNSLDRKDVLKHLVKSTKDLRYLHVENVRELQLDNYPLETVEHLRIECVKNLEFPPLYSIQKRCKKLLRLEILFAEKASVGGSMLARTFPALQFLKLHFSPNDWEVKNLKIKLVQHAVAKQIEGEFLIDKLTDDCLLNIISYLSIGACLSLASTHLRFRMLFSENSFSGQICITGELTKLHPIEEMRSAYDSVCRNIVSLHLSKIKQRDALEVLSRCENLKHLVIESLSLRKSDSIDQLPKDLKSLEVNFAEIKSALWTDWCSELNRSLRALAICKLYHKPYSNCWDESRIDGIARLTKIREFRFTGATFPRKLKKFLSTNSGTLEHLQLVLTPDSPTLRIEAEAMATLFARLKKLKVLNTGGFPIMLGPPIPLARVTDLTCDEWTVQLKPTAKNVKSLRLRPCGNDPENPEHAIRTDLATFKNLENLNYFEREGDLGVLATLKKLRHLTITSDPSDDDIMAIIRALPQLTRMSLNAMESDCPEDFLNMLAAYLEREQRPFRFNEEIYDGRGASRTVDEPPPFEEDERMGQDGDSLNFYGSDADSSDQSEWGENDSSDGSDEEFFVD